MLILIVKNVTSNRLLDREIRNFNYVDLECGLESSTIMSFIPHKKVITRPRDKRKWSDVFCLAIRKRDPDRSSLEIYSRFKTPVSWHRYRAPRNLVLNFVMKAKANIRINIILKLTKLFLIFT